MDELNNLFGGVDQLWQYIKEYASKAGCGATRVVLELYYVMKSPQTPTVDKTIIIAALGYQLLPNDLMSRKKFGWLGLIDNGVTLAIAYNRVKKRVTPQIEAQVSAILNQWFGTEEDLGHTQIPDNNNIDNWQSQQSNPHDTAIDYRYSYNTAPPLVGYDDNEDVVID